MMLAGTVLIVLAFLMLSEWIWRQRRTHGEFSRKFVHITVGSFVAFWPYFLSVNEIRLLSLAFIIGAALSKYFHIFSTIHSVQRPTWGEFWFALVVGLLATMAAHPHIYTAALLVMSLSDGLAAVIGTKYGNGTRYQIFGSSKSMIGSLTFAIVTALILIGYSILTPGALPVLALISTVIVATVLENVAVRGLDNLLVPIFIAAVLRYFA
jgi:dolichol kinase